MYRVPGLVDQEWMDQEEMASWSYLHLGLASLSYVLSWTKCNNCLNPFVTVDVSVKTSM